MYPENGTTTPNPNPTPCGDNCGTLPPCAPLAVPYVPFQQKGSKQYEAAEALNNGTIFPALNLPFHVKTKPSGMANGLLGELQALEFVLVELGLYLDTHRDDKEAFACFQKYAALEQEARQRYEAQHGPLLQTSAANGDSYTWPDDPWPWSFMEGGSN